MATEPTETVLATRDASSILHVLATAMGDGPLPAGDRVCAVDERSPDEGLALLGAYIAIEDRAVRQAVLDALIMISTRR